MTWFAVSLHKQLPNQDESCGRRPGKLPGRRFAFAAVPAAIVASALAAPAGPALAGSSPSVDQAVLSATIFPGAQGSPTSQTVAESALAGCPPYDGPNTFTLEPTGQPITVNLSASWTLSTLLTCGLRVPQSDVTAVQVVNPQTGADQAPLSAADVFDPSAYPTGGGGLPTISDIGAGQLQYVRPWLGGADSNAADNFSVSGQPVSVYLFEHQPPLTVTVTATPVPASETVSGERVALQATVTGPDGAPVEPTQLTYRWTVAGAPVSTASTPTLPVVPGSTIVSVEVADSATGTGGTGGTTVSYSPSPSKGGHDGRQGTGHHPRGNPSGSPSGDKNSRGSHHGAKPAPRGGGHQGPRHSTSGPTASTPQTTGKPRPTPPPSAGSTPNPPAATTTTTATTSTSTSTSTSTTTATTTQAPPRHTHPQRRQARHRAPRPGEREVSGRLVADIEPLPPDASPLARAASDRAASPALVHAAQTTGPIPGWVYAIVAVLALAGAGAWRERRGVRSLKRLTR